MGSHDRSLRIAILLCLTGLMMVAFMPAFWADFVEFDDPNYVFRNTDVLRGLTRESIFHAIKEPLLNLWHPLSVLSFMIDRELFGINAMPMHVVNVMIHTVSVALLFALLVKLTSSTWRSAVVCALFALHPLRVESVVWIAERKDVLSVMFFLLTLLAYVHYVRARAWWAYAAAAFFLFLSLTAKPMFVTAPAVLLLLDYWPLRRSKLLRDMPAGDKWRRTATLAILLIEKIPILLVSIGVSFLVMHASQPDASEAPLVKQMYLTHPLSLRLENAAVSYVRYIWKTLWFYDLAIYYPMPEYWPTWQVVAALLMVLLATVGVLLVARRHPHLVVGWFWYLICLFPVIGVVTQVCDYSMADRYTYLSTVGLLVMLVWSLPERVSQLKLARCAFAAVLSVMGTSTYVQATRWRNTITLFVHAISVTHDNPLAEMVVGGKLFDSGQFAEALPHFQETLRLRPNFGRVHFYMGRTMAAMGRYEEAIAAFRRSSELDPKDDECLVAWGVALSERGSAADAIALFQNAIQRNPRSKKAYTNWGLELVAQGKYEEALLRYQAAIEIDPYDATTYTNMAEPFLKLGRIDEMLRQSEAAIRIDPQSADAHYNMAVGLLQIGQVNPAIAHLKQSISLNPDDPAARQLLAEALGRARRVP